MLAVSARAMIENVTAEASEAHCARAFESLCSAHRTKTNVPRVTLVSAHPDDEVIGAGGRLPHLRDVAVVHVTDGAPRDMTDARRYGFATRESYARARATERERALALARVPREHIHDIGLIDQEASLALTELTYHLADLFDRARPDVVLTHAYEGGHPDHDATAFAVHQAVRRLLLREGVAPVIVEFTGYYWRDGAMRTGEFVPHGGTVARTLSLGADEGRRKQAMFACYATQQQVLASFGTNVEHFRIAPTYDFTAPPHPGRLFYEWFDWRVNGEAWRQLARRALHALET